MQKQFPHPYKSYYLIIINGYSILTKVFMFVSITLFARDEKSQYNIIGVCVRVHQNTSHSPPTEDQGQVAHWPLWAQWLMRGEGGQSQQSHTIIPVIDMSDRAPVRRTHTGEQGG